MARIGLPFYAAAAMCAGPVMFWKGFRDLRTRRLILNTPTSRIRSMAMGLVEIEGSVLERSLVTAPFSGHECVYWEVDIAVRANRRGGWSIVHRRSSGNPFYVSDGTGLALVYPQGSVCTVPSACEEECNVLSLPDVYGDYMKREGLWQRYLWRLSALRFRERSLEEGARVYILGSAEPRAISRDVANPAMAEETGPHAEWIEPEIRATGTEGANPARVPGLAARLLHAGSTPDIPIRGPGRVRALHDRVSAVIRRGSNEPTFIISSESQSSLALSLGFSTFGKLVGGPLLTLFGLGYWLLELSSRRAFN